MQKWNKKALEKRQQIHATIPSKLGRVSKKVEAKVLEKIGETGTDSVEALQLEVKRLTPAHGVNPFNSSQMKHKKERLQQETEDASSTTQKSSTPSMDKFADLPISKKTLTALTDAGYLKMTDIQSASILHLLAGRDVLGAAKTGSGKTLAFLVPLLENLYRITWTKYDGLGALILTPSRELAIQIFEVLRLVGKKHNFSAGLLVGGMKNFLEEQKHIGQMNILVATPGRLLQHMDQTPDFNYSNLQILVLDEADRLLEMGFSHDLNSILEHLPIHRQTILFSATQTKSVKDLARLALKKENTEYISTHEEEIVPKKLEQFFVTCEVYEKIDILFSFIQSHQKAKSIVFVSTAKQARFLFEAFQRLDVGTTVCLLYGGMSQKKRRDSYELFLAKRHAVLIATDVASRGLDFPLVEYVISLDIPTSMELYIHRVGRTARLKASGRAMTLVLPQERSTFLEHLQKKNMTIKENKINPVQLVSIKLQLASLIANDIQMKFLAMRYFDSYLQHLAKNIKWAQVDIDSLNLDEFASRLGLLERPKVKLTTTRKEDSVKKIVSRAKEESDMDEEDVDEYDEDEFGSDMEAMIASDEEEEEGEEGSEEEDDLIGEEESEDAEEQEEEQEEETKEEPEFENSDDEMAYLLRPTIAKKKKKSQVEKILGRKPTNITDEKIKQLSGASNESDDEEPEEEFFTVKRKDHELEDSEKIDMSLMPRRTKLDHGLNTRIKFGTEGKQISTFESVVNEIKSKKEDLTEEQSKYAQQIKQNLAARDETDKELTKAIRKELKGKQTKEVKQVEDLKKQVKTLEQEKILKRQRAPGKQDDEKAAKKSKKDSSLEDMESKALRLLDSL